MKDAVLLVIYSFGASLGFGIVFQIERKFLLLAGLCGAITRIVYLFLQQFTDEIFIYTFLAAMAAALFSECMATITKRPSTVFLYPSIVPLMPGSLLYYSVVGLLVPDAVMIETNALVPCIHALAGLGLGFVVISMVMYYRRRYPRHRRRKLQRTVKEET